MMSRIDKLHREMHGKQMLHRKDALAAIAGSFALEVLQQLPMEFAVGAQKLLGTGLEGSVG